MDAIEFVKQLRRMEENAGRKYRIFVDSPEDVVAEVEKWAKMNPVKTRQSVFLEQWPEANLDAHGCVCVRPCHLSATHRNAYGNCAHMGRDCGDCRREFWMQEVE